jgi:fumarylacetoacetase
MAGPDIDETHDPRLESRVLSANGPTTDFPIQNLPLGAFRTAATERSRIGVAIGDLVLDLHGAAEAGLLPGDVDGACREASLNTLLSCGPGARRVLRRAVSSLLKKDGRPLPERLLRPRAEVEMLLPAAVGDYTDFYTSIHHATRVGALMRPENPLLPNYKWVPIAYHGRASSIVPSGAPIRRPHGQLGGDDGPPAYAPSRRLDYEAEVGFWIGPGNGQGAPIPIAEAPDHIAGLCLLNDWSARDVQKWEYQPLGPFLAKSFATTISPWLVTVEALAPFRRPLRARSDGDPRPLPYLLDAGDQAAGGFDVRVEALLSTRRMREEKMEPMRVSAASLLDLYWTPAQMVAHHASNGCNLRPGDLLASGTVSGPTLEGAGCLLERTAGGKEPLTLPNGETRRFLEDGDEVILRAAADRAGFRSIGFGDCRGVVVAA